jgi:hypothetical protein
MALDREDLIGGPRQMVRLLRERDEPGGIRVAGGAALSLRYFDRGTTDDVDAKVHPPEAALQAAAEIATINGWPDDWFNTKAAMFIPFGTAEWEPLYDDGDVGIWVASAGTLLAMKLRASRPARDDDDIASLLAICGIDNEQDAADHYERYYPGEILEPKAERMLRTIFARGLPDRPAAPVTPSFE